MLDWPTATVWGVTIIAGIASTTKIVTTRMNNRKECDAPEVFKKIQTKEGCDSKHAILDAGIMAIKENVETVQESVSGLH